MVARSIVVSFGVALAGCAPEVPAPEATPVPLAAPAPPPPAPAPPPAPVEPPAPTEYCDADGWCTPYRVLPFQSVAASGEAVAIGNSQGVVALWADGEWRGGFTVASGSTVAAVTRAAGATTVVTCHGNRCEQRTWTPDGFGPATPAPRTKAHKGVSRLGDWHVEYASLLGPAGLRLHPTTALAQKSCATEFTLYGDAEAPFAVCRQWTAQSLHHVVNGHLVTLSQPWDTLWVNAGPLVRAGAGCEPCLVTLEGILVHGEGRWDVYPMSSDAWRAATPDTVEPDFPPLQAPPVTIARDGDFVSLGFGERVWTWEDGWVRGKRDGAWAEPVKALPWADDAHAYALPDALLVLDHRYLKLRSWERFLPDDAAPKGFADVKGVASDDVLHVRSGPHAAAPALADLQPDARCVPVLDATSKLSGQPWRAVALPDGRRGWVNTKYLRAAEGCGGAAG
jgi:hypothetical protein